MNLTPLLSTFAIIALAELGDKTQLTVITLCTKHKPKIVFLASFLALTGIGSASILIGSTITRLIPLSWIRVGAGFAFLGFGIHTLLEEEERSFSCEETTFAATLSLVAMMELGDKTQLATITLAARFASPIAVFLGMGLSFLLITGLGVLIGSKLREYLSREHIRLGSSLIFIALGIIFILSTITGVSVF